MKAHPLVWQALSKSCSQGNAQFRRSLYFVKDMKAGDVITEDCVRSVRPGYGLAPKYLELIVGKRINRAISAHTPVLDSDLK